MLIEDLMEELREKSGSEVEYTCMSLVVEVA